jgi:hypothetical protein
MKKLYLVCLFAITPVHAVKTYVQIVDAQTNAVVPWYVCLNSPKTVAYHKFRTRKGNVIFKIYHHLMAIKSTFGRAKEYAAQESRIVDIRSNQKCDCEIRLNKKIC